VVVVEMVQQLQVHDGAAAAEAGLPYLDQQGQQFQAGLRTRSLLVKVVKGSDQTPMAMTEQTPHLERPQHSQEPAEVEFLVMSPTRQTDHV
jgi:hypothetical protein